MKPNLQPLIDADIIRYELGFAAETGWRAIREDPDAIPPFEYVQDLLHQRLENIKGVCQTTLTPLLYYTSGRTFRYDIAKKKPYKGTRKENKPWHFDNLTVYMRDVLGAEEVSNIEADDRLAMVHTASQQSTILCSRDKDLMQVPGYFYCWELGRQPSWGPGLIDTVGDIELAPKNDKIKGTGEAFFWSQVLTGDPTDNTPGLPNCGPVAAYAILKPITDSYKMGDMPERECLIYLEKAVCEAYRDVYGEGPNLFIERGHSPAWLVAMQEQVDLHWLLRGLNEDGSPMLRKVNIC